MRRMLAVAALAAALFAAGCGGSDSNTPGGGSTPTTDATTTGDLAADTKAICESTEKIVSAGLVTILSEVGKLTAAEAAKDQAAADRARAAAEAAAMKLASDIRAEAAKAQDPALKSALETAVTQFETMAKDVKGINEQKLQAAGSEITKICA